MPNLFSRPGQNMPPQGPALVQSHPQQAPLNRITNPNYEGQVMPAPSPNLGPPSAHNLMPMYGRNASPAPEMRPMMENRPPSPRSVFPGLQQAKLFRPSHHSESGAPGGIAGGAPPPASAMVAAEAAARDRDDRPPSVVPFKRHREWEDREDDGMHKKNATEETRARLEDPHHGRRSPALPMTPQEREKPGPSRMSAILSAPPSASKSSPDGGRRAEEVRLANENYRPSEVAHHPAPLNTILHQQERKNENIAVLNAGTPLRGGTPAKREPTPMRNGPDEAHIQRQRDREEMDRRDREREMERQERERRDRERREISMRIEEPAARKMDIEEDYDDDSGADDNRSRASVKGAAPAAPAPASAAGGPDSRGSPRVARGSSVVSASGPSSLHNGMSNGGGRAKVDNV